MDRFTRNYLIGLAVIAAIALVWIFYESPAVAELNDRLAANPDVAAYPYRFRVLALDNAVASMSTPRSADFPASRALAILYPALRNESANSEAMLEAQQEMARVQAIARDIVTSSEDVRRVKWVLDESWLRSHGVEPDLN